MSYLSIRKVLALPALLEPNIMYVIKNGDDQFFIKVTDDAGNIALSQTAEVGAVNSSAITDASPIGLSLLTAANAADIRTLLNVFDKSEYQSSTEFYKVANVVTSDFLGSPVVFGTTIPETGHTWAVGDLVYVKTGLSAGNIYRADTAGDWVLFKSKTDSEFVRFAICENVESFITTKKNGVFINSSLGSFTSTAIRHIDASGTNTSLRDFLLSLVTKLGDLASLSTSEKSNIVSAINEVKALTDAAVLDIEAVQQASGGVGSLASLETTDKTSAVAAINEVKAVADSASDAIGDLQTKANTIGFLASLTTTDKSNTVAAINEVKALADSASAVAESAQIQSESIGSLTSLTTTNKSSLVGAINEVNLIAISVADLVDDLQVKTDTIGPLASLTTTDKSNAVAAINEVKALADAADLKASGVGTLSSLTTTEKSNTVLAINEVKSLADATKLKTDTIGEIGSLTTTDKTSIVDAVNELKLLSSQPSTSSDKLSTARSLNVNLASPTAFNFDGTADGALGVTGTLPVANGGTGGNSAAEARAALGVPPTIGTATMENVVLFNTFEKIIDLGTTSAIDFKTGGYFKKTITAPTTFSVAAVIPGYINSFQLQITNGGNFAITWWAGIEWEAGLAPVLTLNGKDAITFIHNGTTWCGFFVSKDLK